MKKKNEIICICGIKKDEDDYLNDPIRILNYFDEEKEDELDLEGL